ncbi:MAG: glycosyltransferase family 2 protein [Nitrospirae bacterium]|nr:glycosyltransferase family 2 protein [Nitrospirota bacterium]
MPLVSVIILNYNGRDYIEECLNSVFDQTYKSIEIIVVDNASKDGSKEILKDKYRSKIKLIENPANLGFAEGNNVGLKNASGEFIALLNNDAIANKRWLEELISGFQRCDASFGMWASKILFYDDQRMIDTAGHLIYPDGLNRGRGKGEIDIGQYDKEEEVFFPSGCAALYRKNMLDEIGFFDPDFFAYGDDTDVGLKARLSGWKCLYMPGAVVYHHSSATAGRYSPMKAYLVERNRVWILIKYFPLRYILLSPFYTGLRWILQLYGAISGTGAAGRFTGEYSLLKLAIVFLRAYIDAIKGLAKMIKKRIRMRKIKKMNSGDFSLWLKRFKIGAVEIALRE